MVYVVFVCRVVLKCVGSCGCIVTVLFDIFCCTVFLNILSSGHLNINMTVSELLNKAHRLVINEEVLTRLQVGL